MGLFKKRQDNYTLIADNVVAFYMILRDNFSQSYNMEQLLFATGLMDTFLYLDKGKLTPNDSSRAVYYAKRGECAIKGNKLVHARENEEDMADYNPDETELLVNFIMQLECEMMTSDRRGNPGGLINVIYSKKDVIRETVEKGLEAGKDHKFYAALEDQAKEWFFDKNMNRMVSGFRSK